MARSREGICLGRFPGKRDHGGVDVSVEESDINSSHHGVGRERHGDEPYGLKEMVSTFNI